jgi:hypothetical protein
VMAIGVGVPIVPVAVAAPTTSCRKTGC